MSSTPDNELENVINLLREAGECLQNRDALLARELMERIAEFSGKVPNADTIVQALRMIVTEASTKAPVMQSTTQTLTTISCQEAITSGDIPGTSDAAGAELQNAAYPELRIFSLRQATVIGPSGAIFTPTGKLLNESVVGVEVEKSLSGLEGRVISTCHNYSGTIAPLHGFWAEGFWHWMLEWLPKVIVLEKSGRRPSYVVPRGRRYIIDSLLMLDVGPERIVEHTHDSYTADELLLTNPVVGGAIERYPAVMFELRERFLKNHDRSVSGPRHLYLSRVNPNRPRRVLNESALEGYLGQYSFESRDMESLPLAQQIGAMRNVDILVGPHGAGMIHSLFMRPNATVIELFAPTYINPCIVSIIRLMNHRYYIVPSTLWTGTYPHGDNIQAFWPLVAAIVERELNSDPFATERSKFNIR